MINVEAEVSKHKNIKDRDELVMLIKDYKNLALKNATNLAVAGQYSKVAQKLQEFCDKLPAPKLMKYPSDRTQGIHAETAEITSEEQARIDADWKKRTKS